VSALAPTAVSSPDLRVEPRRFSDLRLAAFRAVERTCAALGGRAFYRRAFLAPGRFDLRHERVEVGGLPAGLEGFRVAQLSDLHAGSFLGEGDLADVVERVLEWRPDLCVVTGDLITRRWTESLTLLEDLARLASRVRVLGVFGNHDYHGRDEGRIAAAYAERGIELLRDECRRIDTGDGVLAVVGLEDLEEARAVDVDAARAGLRPGDVELVLCHNPLGGPWLARRGCAARPASCSSRSAVDAPSIVSRTAPTTS